jgi:hypothetical protein
MYMSKGRFQRKIHFRCKFSLELDFFENIFHSELFPNKNTVGVDIGIVLLKIV